MSSRGDNVEARMKRAKLEQKEEEDKIDLISEMPDSILSYILTKVSTKDAVRTCILAKRWQNMWKYVPKLKATTKDFQFSEFFKRFVAKYLKNRDPSMKLTIVDFEHEGFLRSPIAGKIINYAVAHGVEDLRVRCYINYEQLPKLRVFNASKFKCNTLKRLHLSFHNLFNSPVLPVTMDFPELVECELRYASFRSEDETVACAEPFSGCKKMKSLSIESCTLRNANHLLVVGDQLTHMTVSYKATFPFHPIKVHMKTPNLTSFAYVGPIAHEERVIVFEHNLNLQEARMEVCCHRFGHSNAGKTLFNLLSYCTTVQSLTISTKTIQILSEIPGFPNANSLNLGNLRRVILKVDHEAPCHIGGPELNYLLKDSPMVELLASLELPAYYDEIIFGRRGETLALYYEGPLGRFFPW